MSFRLSLTSSASGRHGGDVKNGGRTLLDIYAWRSVAAFSLACEGRHKVLVFIMQKLYLGILLRTDKGCYGN